MVMTLIVGEFWGSQCRGRTTAYSSHTENCSQMAGDATITRHCKEKAIKQRVCDRSLVLVYFQLLKSHLYVCVESILEMSN